VFLTSNETTKTRTLYETKETTFKPMYKFGVFCNHKPVFDSNDSAIWRRTKCIEFSTVFVSNPKLPHEKKINTQLGAVLHLWKQDFMLILIEIFKKYQKEGLIPPACVENFTKEHKAMQNVCSMYIADRIVVSKHNLLVSDMYKDFTNWYNKNYNDKKIPSITEFRDSLKTHYNLNKITKVRCGKEIAQGINKIGFKPNPLDKGTDDNNTIDDIEGEDIECDSSDSE
jgi:phage/plasmid-associated DNA primase